MKKFFGIFCLLIAFNVCGLGQAWALLEGDCMNCTFEATDQCWIIPDPAENLECYMPFFQDCLPTCCSDSCAEYVAEICSESEDYQACYEEEMEFCKESCCEDSCLEGIQMECEMRCEDYCRYEVCGDICDADDESDECYSCIDSCISEGVEGGVGCMEQCDILTSECMNGCMSGTGDYDGDTIPDDIDNCPTVPNEDQGDGDDDGIGDACDICPAAYDPDQVDSDGDCAGDACDLCPDVFSNNSFMDLDGDMVGNACDDDIDGDGVLNIADNCLYTPNADQSDSDSDGVGDACDWTDRHLGQDEVTILDPQMYYRVQIFLPDNSGTRYEADPPAQPFRAVAYDILTTPYKSVISGTFQPANCNEFRETNFKGWLLGDDSDYDPATPDAIDFSIVPGGNSREFTAIHGMISEGRFAGDYLDRSGITHGFVCDRFYEPEFGMWIYSFTTLDYPDSTYSSIWDAAMVTSLGREVQVGRYKDQSGKMHGFTHSRYYDGSQFQEEWLPIDVFEADETYAHGINAQGMVTGYYVVAGETHGFYCDNGTCESIDVPGANATYCYRINDSGIIAGYYRAGGNTLSFLYSIIQNKFITFDVKDAINTVVMGIDEMNHAVGYFIDSSGQHPFLTAPISFGPGPSPCSGDIDRDGDVDGTDLAVLASNYGSMSCSDSSCGDITDIGEIEGESQVNQEDVRVFAEEFADCSMEGEEPR